MNTNNKTKCAEADSTLLLYLYGEAEDPVAFEAHMTRCDECRGLFESHRQVLTAYRAEAVDLPSVAIDLSMPSLWDRVVDFFGSPMMKPAFAAATVIIIAAVALLVAVPPYQPDIVASGVPSYIEMESQMDAIDADLDNLTAMNESSDIETASTDYDASSNEEYTNIVNELDEIQNDINNF